MGRQEMKQSNYWHPACDRFLIMHGDKYEMEQLKMILNRSGAAIKQRKRKLKHEKNVLLHI